MSAPQVGDVIVIGPECFADAEETVVCWKGRNYYLPPDDGQRPRPERVVKAEALREAVKAWGGNWGREGRDVMFNHSGDDLTPQGRVGKWLDASADRIKVDQ